MTTIHLVSHTHWDREWYLTFQQFRLKLVHLVDGLLDILGSDPHYKYFLLDGQAIILEDYLQIRPERESDLLRFIHDGRIIIGPWYVSPDEFLLSAESHLRNLFEGDRLCRKYGNKMLVGYLPDTFGHIEQMPQILQGFGIDSACLWRGLADQPCELIWQAPDGSTVLLSFLRDSYGNAANLTTSNPLSFSKEINERSDSLSTHSVTGHLLLMHGTDHMEPAPGLSAVIGCYQDTSQLYTLLHSNLQDYFAAVRFKIESDRIQLPVITGELRSSRQSALLQNILSTRIWLKQRNHACETELLKWVEPINALASVLYPPSHSPAASDTSGILTNREAIIRHAWKLLMQCHPHDSICGTSIDQVANEMRVRFDQVDQISHELEIQCLQEMVDQIDNSFSAGQFLSETHPDFLSVIVVFNPNDAPQTGLVRIDLKLDSQQSSFDVIDEQGNLIPFDQVGMGSRQLISTTLDNKSMKQALGMIHEGTVAGMVIRDFEINRGDNQAFIRVTLSDHGEVDLKKWNAGINQLDGLLSDSSVRDYIIHAFSDPEINLSLVAGDVPGHGYRCYWVRAKTTDNRLPSPNTILNPFIKLLLPLVSKLSQIPVVSRILAGRKLKFTAPSNSIENEFFKIEVIKSENTISIMDKRTHQLYKDLNKFIDGADCGDLYNYCPPENDLVVSAKIVKVEAEVRKTSQILTVKYELRISARIASDRRSRSSDKLHMTIDSVLTVIPGVPRIDVHTVLDNRASDHRLRVHFPAPFSTTASWQDGHFEMIERPTALPDFDSSWEEPPRPEVPQSQFTAISNDQVSLIIANQGLPEVEVFTNKSGNSEIALTLLRCVGSLSRDDLTTRKGHAGPMGIATPDAQMIGQISFDYSIIPAGKDWQNSIQYAYSFNAPLKSISTQSHSGSLPSSCSLIENKNPNFVITAIKHPENGSGVIVRGYNTLPSPIELSIKPFRVFNQVQLVRLDEKPIESLAFSAQGTINLNVEGNKIITLLLKD